VKFDGHTRQTRGDHQPSTVQAQPESRQFLSYRIVRTKFRSFILPPHLVTLSNRECWVCVFGPYGSEAEVLRQAASDGFVALQMAHLKYEQLLKL
jgi:hypothetical protein